ncbi:MAG: UDP-N-acetylmuramate dehydrogenase [Bacteroidota bacterium]|nr:UDP-N-acetylmuramate dehydrogenase [Bacteroidota bacterium]
MLEFKKNYCLKKHNTFGINVKAKHFVSFSCEEQLKAIINSEIFYNNKTCIIGGGSNILLTKDFDGLILHNTINKIHVLEDNEEFVIVEVGGGVNWHEFVQWSIDLNLSGIENLALIPGSVGASPVQNIGAYGMEVKDTITKVHAFEIEKKAIKIFDNQECRFEYRNSVFKSILKDKIIITKVEFKLSKTPLNKTTYGSIEEELYTLKLKPSPKNIAKAVTNIRNKKLPNPIKLGNSGSFFKNPIISKNKFESLKKEFPQIVGYQISNNKIKLAAGWLIENAGMKGFRENNVGVHKKQALVIVNYGDANGKDIMNLAEKIQKIISEKYGIQIEPEVKIL